MIEVVYAKAVEKVPLRSGQIAQVITGQHWPATDEVVRTRPDLFTDDPRYGLIFSEAPPGYDGALQPLEDFEEATAVPGEKRSVRRRRTEEDRDGA